MDMVFDSYLPHVMCPFISVSVSLLSIKISIYVKKIINVRKINNVQTATTYN